jgi:GNAT superfamily N-acetyltransferase
MTPENVFGEMAASMGFASKEAAEKAILMFSRIAARGKRVGRALINAVYERAKDAGSPRVYWLTHETNRIARELYDKVAENSGFVMYRKLF